MDLQHLSKKNIVEKRRKLYHLLNGDAFYPSKNWPKDTLSIFWKKRIGDLDTFKIMLFFIGNGCSPQVISEWILSSQYWAEPTKWNKRKSQIDFIHSNINTKRHIRFYYDIRCNDWLYLNGLKRFKNQEISLQFLNSTSTLSAIH